MSWEAGHQWFPKARIRPASSGPCAALTTGCLLVNEGPHSNGCQCGESVNQRRKNDYCDPYLCEKPLPTPQDLMVKNIKRHQRLIKRDGGNVTHTSVTSPLPPCRT